MKKAIITGPTGTIGMALINELVNNGVEVVAVVRPNSTRSSRIVENSKIKKVECDLSELDKLPEILEKENISDIDTFYHFAWDGTFGNSRNNMYGQNENVKYSLDAVKAASRIKCKTFIGSGSQAEYGRFEGKLNALTPTFPENGYGIAKLCAGQMTRIMCEEFGIKHIWTRILSIYGPYDGDKTMIMSLISSLLQGQKPSCTLGEQKWDYLYSKDAAKAFRLLGEKGKHGKIYTIGSGSVRPLKDYIVGMKNQINPKAEIGFGDIPYGNKQVMYLCADITELVNDTGFEPGYSFEEGINETIDWIKNGRR